MSEPASVARESLCPGSRSAAVIAVLTLLALAAGQARAAPGAPGPDASGTSAPPAAASSSAPRRARRAEAERHFESGIKLYRDGNYEGALAEFRAAYRLKPSASSLQNIALCLKGLFRYAEAADTLQKLLDRYSDELSEKERQTVKDAMYEMGSLVGTLSILVEPPDAQVSVDGHSVPAARRAQGVRLNVGEHTVTAQAPGYAPLHQVVSVAGGRDRVPLELRLTPVDGFVEVDSGDPDAAIALDGKPLAFHHWRGPVAPGRHYVQVYKQGYKTFEQVVYVELGKTSEVTAELGPPLPPSKSAPNTPPASTRQLRGLYGLVVVTALGVDGAPAGVDNSTVQASQGGLLGVRAGYRLWTPIAIEALVEGGRQQFDHATVSDCSGCTRSYRLSSFRLGPNLRFMSGDEKLRFTSTLGVGAVQHGLKFEALSAPTNATIPADARAHNTDYASGWGAYLLGEVGAQYNWGHILLEGDAVVFLDQADNVKNDATHWSPYYDTQGIIMVGLGLRVGWSEWTPAEAAKSSAR